jgi:hypothetical protein
MTEVDAHLHPTQINGNVRSSGVAISGLLSGTCPVSVRGDLSSRRLLPPSEAANLPVQRQRMLPCRKDFEPARHVRFGSLADIEERQSHVRFTPEADMHRRRLHVR